MSARSRIAPSDSEIAQAIDAGKKYDRSATKILSARYDRDLDVLVVQLSTGAVLTVPRRLLPRFDVYTPDQFGQVSVEQPGYAIWFDQPDLGIGLEGIIRAISGESVIQELTHQRLASREADEVGFGTQKPRRGPSETSTRVFKPGDIAPRSGHYIIVGPRGGRGGETLIIQGQRLPPTPKKGSTYVWERPASSESGRK